MTTDLATCKNAIPTVIATPLFRYTRVELELVRDHIVNCPECLREYGHLTARTTRYFEQIAGEIVTARTETQAMLSRMNSAEMVARRGTVMTPYGWQKPNHHYKLIDGWWQYQE